MRAVKRIMCCAVWALLVGLLTASPALPATLLPNGEQTFVDANGQPYSSGRVYFYLPSTTTPKDTWNNPGQTVLNSNPVVLDAAGRAIIYGIGTYRQVLKDQYGNTIWDQLTSGLGTSGQIINTVISGSLVLTSCSGFYPINNQSSAPITITMTTSPADGDSCQFGDTGGNSGIYPVTFQFGAKSLATGGSSYQFNHNGTVAGFIWLATPNLWQVE